MGDRVSISFSGEGETSVALFSHWGGKEFVEKAVDYAQKLLKRKGGTYPLDRYEPSTVMVDFIRHVTKGLDVVDSDLYLGATADDGDNSDNGHYEIHISKEDGVKVLQGAGN